MQYIDGYLLEHIENNRIQKLISKGPIIIKYLNDSRNFNEPNLYDLYIKNKSIADIFTILTKDSIICAVKDLHQNSIELELNIKPHEQIFIIIMKKCEKSSNNDVLYVITNYGRIFYITDIIDNNYDSLAKNYMFYNFYLSIDMKINLYKSINKEDINNIHFSNLCDLVCYEINIQTFQYDDVEDAKREKQLYEKIDKLKEHSQFNILFDQINSKNSIL